MQPIKRSKYEYVTLVVLYLIAMMVMLTGCSKKKVEEPDFIGLEMSAFSEAEMLLSNTTDRFPSRIVIEGPIRTIVYEHGRGFDEGYKKALADCKAIIKETLM